MEVFDAYPEKKEQMITMFNNMEPYLNKLLTNGSRIELPLKSMDGVMVDGMLCACMHFHDDHPSHQSLLITLESNRTDHILYQKHFNTIPDFIIWLATEYHILRYNKLKDIFCLEQNEQLEYEIIKHFPDNERVKMAFEDCSVCLSGTKAQLPCNHFLCRQCESSIKIPKCPICREYYHDQDGE